MSEQVNRYTLNIVIDEQEYPFLRGNLENIYEFTTKLNSNNDLRNFIEVEYNYKFTGKTVSFNISYNQNGPKYAPLFYYRDHKYYNDKEKLRQSFIYDSHNKAFLPNFLRLYENFYLKKDILEIINKIYKNEDVPINKFNDLTDKLLSSLKGKADVYQYILYYEKEKSDKTVIPSGRKSMITAEELNKIRSLLKNMVVLEVKEHTQTTLFKEEEQEKPINYSNERPLMLYRNVYFNIVEKTKSLDEIKRDRERMKCLLAVGNYEALIQEFPDITKKEIEELEADLNNNADSLIEKGDYEALEKEHPELQGDEIDYIRDQIDERRGGSSKGR